MDEVTMICNQCGALARSGELSCMACGALFFNPLRTKRLGAHEETPQWVPVGELVIPGERRIVLWVDETEIPLIVEESITLGRSGATLDLASYNGVDLGVSRSHAQIRRDNLLLYLSDLGSTNGTYLNGRQIPMGTERILRDGDEIQLGNMKMRLSLS